MTLAFNSAETSPFVRAFLTDQGIAEGSLDLAIDDRDEMLSFLVAAQEGDRDRALFAYFRSGLSVADAMTQALRWRFGGMDKVGRLLDFASGYGRVTRFFLRELPAERVCVADVYADGVRFQTERFGVQGIVSTVRPEDFSSPESVERFDAITVTSLFTHLPDRRFVDWLRVLLGLLRPGGVLLFSVHGPEVLPPGVPMPESGMLFQELSESASLDTSDYGSTWVTEDYVRAAVERAADGPVSVHRLLRGLCNYQDLYVVTREAGTDFAGLAFQGEAHLQIEELAQVEPDILLARGWAGVISGGVRAVEVTLDGVLLGAAPVVEPRQDVAAQFGERFLPSGWRCRVPLPPATPRRDAVLIVRVVDSRGQAQPLWAGSIEGALLLSARQQAAHLKIVLDGLRAHLAAVEARAAGDKEYLTARIAGMEASRFWKLRTAWFRVREALGIGVKG
jgi:SAM-dependent methyltransferase